MQQISAQCCGHGCIIGGCYVAEGLEKNACHLHDLCADLHARLLAVHDRYIL